MNLQLSTITIKQWLLATATLGGVELLSWLAYSHGELMTPVFLIVVGAAIVVAVRRPHWLALVTVTELVIGGKGYVFFLLVGDQKISIRLALFIVALAMFAWRWLRHRSGALVQDKLFWLFTGWLTLAWIWPVLRGVAPGQVFLDGNAFIYLGLLFVWWSAQQQQLTWLRTAILWLLAGVTIVGLKSWIILLLFGQNIDQLPTLYRWIRNTGVGEVTLITKSVYRVFFQGQIYGLLISLFVLGAWATKQVKAWWLIPATIGTLAVTISLSRSFWLGAGVGLLSCLVVSLRQSAARRRSLMIVPIIGLSWVLMNWAIYWPALSPRAGHAGSGNIVLARLQAAGANQAASARQNQIKPLLTHIAQHPIIGSGFGTTVTYFSTDPRVRGWRTTAAFELGYLDLWLKIGLVGMALYAAWIWGLLRGLRLATDWLLWGPATVGLLTVHLTTPYLNHPLGLGWLMLLAIFSYAKR